MIATRVIANANASEFARFIAKGGDTLGATGGPMFLIVRMSFVRGRIMGAICSSQYTGVVA